MNLKIQKSTFQEDWYLIERAEHDGRVWIDSCGFQTSSRFSDADVEGTQAEMLAIAEAIEHRGHASFKRCMVDARNGPVRFCSPRNSHVDGECSLAEADDLARQIRTMFSGLHPSSEG